MPLLFQVIIQSMHLLSNETEVLAVSDFDVNPTNKEVGHSIGCCNWQVRIESHFD
jgi:hypothetical protein